MCDSQEISDSEFRFDGFNLKYPEEFGETWQSADSRPPKELVDFLFNLRARLNVKASDVGTFEQDCRSLIIPASQIKDEFPDKESVFEELTQKFIEKRGGKLMSILERLVAEEDNQMIPKEEPRTPKEDQVIPKEEPRTPKEDQVIPEEFPVIPEEYPVIPEEYPVIPEEYPVIPKVEKVIPKIEQVISNEDQVGGSVGYHGVFVS